MFIPYYKGFKSVSLFANKYFDTNTTGFVGFSVVM